jgi:mRNA interferase MazF
VAIEQGGIYWHNFGPRQNHLQEGVRPALVVQTDTLSALEGYPNVIVVPLTTRERKSATYIPIQANEQSGLSQQSWAITNQIFTIDKGELVKHIGRVSPAELYAAKEGLKITLAISD